MFLIELTYCIHREFMLQFPKTTRIQDGNIKACFIMLKNKNELVYNSGVALSHTTVFTYR
jgi:hypothetical protein